MGLRARMHALIDELSDERVAELHDFARAPRQAHDADPFREMTDSERQRLRSCLREGEMQIASGGGLTAAEASRVVREA